MYKVFLDRMYDVSADHSHKVLADYRYLNTDTYELNNGGQQEVDITGLTFGSQASIDASVTAILSTINSNLSTSMTSDDVVIGSDCSKILGRSFTNPSLAINTSRQPSTTRDTLVTASVDITASLNLSGGTSGKVELKYADDSAFTTNVKTVQGSANGNTGTLTIGLGITQLCTATVTGIVPAGKYYRLVTTNVTGTPTYGTPQIQEVLL